jgi:hypothetical protein
MMFARQLTEGLLNDLLVGSWRYAQDFVIILKEGVAE